MILSLLINVLEIRSNRRLFVSITVRGNALLITWITRRPFQITREMYQLWWRCMPWYTNGGYLVHPWWWRIRMDASSHQSTAIVGVVDLFARARTAINKQRLTNSGFELIGSTQPELLVGGKTRKTDLSKCAKVYIFS